MGCVATVKDVCSGVFTVGVIKESFQKLFETGSE